MLTNKHMVLYTWWYWHICKGEEVRVHLDQLGEEKEVPWCHGVETTASMLFELVSEFEVSGGSGRLRNIRIT
jgi:hypothetical protein